MKGEYFYNEKEDIWYDFWLAKCHNTAFGHIVMGVVITFILSHLLQGLLRLWRASYSLGVCEIENHLDWLKHEEC
jgi:hypothetical protein